MGSFGPPDTLGLPKSFAMRAPWGKYISVPAVGYGTWAPEDPSWCTTAVVDALQAGVRHLDCAWEYGVDRQVGEGIRRSGVPRDEIFITTKFWPNFAEPGNVSLALDKILDAMGLEYVDLFLAHFPAAIKPLPGREGGSFVPTWEAMKQLVYTGKCRAIGVSNFEREHLEEILPHASHSDVPISCNQIEAHPWYPNTALVEFLHDKGILPTIYSPFAPKTFAVNNGVVEACEFAPDGVTLLREPVVNAVAHKNGMDAGQVLQSWAVQRGTVPLAKSRSKSRIASNLAIRRLPDEDELLLNSLEKYGLSGKCIDVNLLFPGVRMR
ncbi:hypothetical protein ASPVEDRAFT_198768 [Aspergillus versicolor CBS 583.65]|uniref:D-xylose reductase [NAD(P)H] n=1 Tax=Aspergillus versicolor CBS 583.65 TaxID=1036611 RepID=A0A1L9PVI8_ASPVE|nr:uncharacterized protein ASPVEDRAFT_198768 [Aspergillus versicolor CBS 583.65]OJJ05537.1 hypothetical protein ASPVEDRAFT_198768 [Aspergillus versicolor CBS 583.65]